MPLHSLFSFISRYTKSDWHCCQNTSQCIPLGFCNRDYRTLSTSLSRTSYHPCGTLQNSPLFLVPDQIPSQVVLMPHLCILQCIKAISTFTNSTDHLFWIRYISCKWISFKSWNMRLSTFWNLWLPPSVMYEEVDIFENRLFTFIKIRFVSLQYK